MNEQSLTVIEPAGQLDLRGDPEVVIEQASRAANALMRVVESRKKKLVVGGKQYLFFEDWQTLGQFYSYSVNTLDAEPVEVNGIPGARARAEVIDFRTGLVVGGAEAFCMSSEEQWAGKPWFQLASMAQCVPLTAEILTRRGFRHFNELTLGEPVLAYDRHSDRCAWVPLENVSVFSPIKGMVRLQSRSFDMHCTLDHSWAVRRLRGQRREPECVLLPVQELAKHHHAIIVAAKSEEGASVITEREAAIMGWLLTDGSIRQTESGRWRGHIDQANPNYIPEIRELVQSVATRETVAQPDTSHLAPNGQPWGKNPCVRWNLATEAVTQLLDRFDIKSPIGLPGAVTQLSGTARRAMLLSMLHADGHNIRATDGLWRFAKNDPIAIDVFQTLCALEGIATGRPHQRTDVASCLVTRRHRVVHGHWLRLSQADPEPTWCPTTPLETWVMRQNGQVTITGNTRAASKALRGRLGWVAVLAGYEATPAEEMTGNEHGHAEKPKEHFCDKHGIAFRRFEKNGNVWYSHKDGEGWCNEGKAREAAPEVPKGDGKTEAPKAKAEQGPPDDVPPPYAEPRPANQDNLPGIAPADRATPQQLTAIYAAARNLSIATLNLEADVAAKFHCQIKELSSDQANSYIDQLNSQ